MQPRIQEQMDVNLKAAIATRIAPVSTFSNQRSSKQKLSYLNRSLLGSNNQHDQGMSIKIMKNEKKKLNKP